MATTARASGAMASATVADVWGQGGAAPLLCPMVRGHSDRAVARAAQNTGWDVTAETPDQSDAALLAAYAAGEARAARVLTLRHGPRVLAQASRMLGQQAEAEDVTQEVMVKLWTLAPDWDAGRARLSTWLYRVTANLCIDRLRRSARVAPLEDAAEPVDDAQSAAAGMQVAARQQALRAALGQLPDRQAQAVALRHFEDLSNPEIARIMDISTDAVESLTARGKRALAAALAPRRSELGVMDD